MYLMLFEAWGIWDVGEGTLAKLLTRISVAPFLDPTLLISLAVVEDADPCKAACLAGHNNPG